MTLGATSAISSAQKILGRRMKRLYYTEASECLSIILSHPEKMFVYGEKYCIKTLGERLVA
jgi:hypothetical protein